jgi:MIP family channel proteins
MKRATFQAAAAEFVGTFALVFASAGASIIHHLYPEALSPQGGAVVGGAVVGVMIYATGHICGAHFNPAVTLAFGVSGRFPWARALPYVVAQLGASALASVAHYVCFPGGHHFGTTLTALPVGPSLVIEAILTFFLMFVIISVATDPRAAKGFEGLAIGGTVAVCIAVGGPLTGASMNPARSFGPALVSGDWTLGWLYWVGPCLGALGAVGVYELLRERGPAPTPEKEGVKNAGHPPRAPTAVTGN